jgi:hypothetical protein
MYTKDVNYFNSIRADIKAEIGKFISIVIREANTPDIKAYTKGACYCGATDKYMAVVDHIAKEYKYSFKRMSGKDIGYCIVNLNKVRISCEQAKLSKAETKKVVEKLIELIKNYIDEFVEKSTYIKADWRKAEKPGILNLYMKLKHIHLPE